jgi:hypothetical protein
MSPVIVGYNKLIYAVLHVAEFHRTPLTSILVFLITLKILNELLEKKDFVLREKKDGKES